MNKIELKNYPLSAKVVKEWFMKEMIESFKDETVPTEFKDFMLEQGIEDYKVEKLINLNYRALFDVFDENNIIIQIIPIKENKIKYVLRVNQFENPYDFKRLYFTRKEAEAAGVILAFNILEKKLTPIEFTNLKEE